MTRAAFPARVIGVGNAGVHLADRVAMLSLEGVEIIAANTDAQSLAASVAPRKAMLGGRVTRGLGAGGDPEVGAEASQEAIEEIRFSVEGAPLVIVLAGLGGGTGSGASPIVAKAARDAGAYVVALVTIPFGFEGRRRSAQAAAAVAALSVHAHAVISFENDRMADLTSPRTGIGETFAASDVMLADCVGALMGLVAGRGPMPVRFGNLAEVISGIGKAIFGHGVCSGENRAHAALERALKSPLLDRGRMLADCTALVAGISGPSTLSFAETAVIMDELTKHVPEAAQLFFGVSVHPDASAPVGVTIFGACGAPEPAPRVRARPAEREVKAEAATKPEPSGGVPSDAVELPRATAADAKPEPPGRLIDVPASEPAPRKGAAGRAPAAPRAKQETLQLEPAARGRFEKIEPTIVEGEDLDVPTFLRLSNRK